MKIRYIHTNIIAEDWKKLSKFYQTVFECVAVLPERNLSGKWLELGTGVEDASLEGIHLRLPGCGADAPTLEIFQYSKNLDRELPVKANRKGFGHIAFQVDDVSEILQRVLDSGGRAVGEIAKHEIPGVGLLTFVYVADPEGNLIELQSCYN